MSAVNGRFYTAEELLYLPDDGRLYELIRGELVEAPYLGAAGGNLTAMLSARVGIWAEEHHAGQGYCAGTGFHIEREPDTVLAPDFAFVAKERLPVRRQDGYLPFAPDLVLETRSPGDTKREVALKVALWMQAGARRTWVLDVEAQTLVVHRPGESPQVLGPDDILSGEDVLPGFELPLRRIFRDVVR